MNKEPKYFAYRIDLNDYREFYDVRQAYEFFNTSKSSVSARAAKSDLSHVIGAKINERWLIFNANLKNEYVQEALKKCRSDEIRFPSGVIKHL